MPESELSRGQEAASEELEEMRRGSAFVSAEESRVVCDGASSRRSKVKRRGDASEGGRTGDASSTTREDRPEDWSERSSSIP